MKIIELQNITFSYEGEEKPVFKNFDFAVEQGQCVAVGGDNGAGKTTLFRILNGLSFPERGKYIFDGSEINKEYLRNNRNMKLFHKRIGYLFQNPDVMLFNSTVYDEIAFGPRQIGLTEDEVKQRTEDCMKLLDLESLSEKAPYHLSGGQKKKVALGAVMALNPEILILDEPFSGLDDNSQNRLLSILSDMKSAGKTILIATHNKKVRENLADFEIIIKK